MDQLTPITYDQYRDKWKVPKYFGGTCFIAGCGKPAEYEGGDARFYCGVCEEHSRIRAQYDSYVKDLERRKSIRKMWTKVLGDDE